MAELTHPRPGAAGASAQAVYEARRRAEVRSYEEELRGDAVWRARIRDRHPLVGRIIAAARPRPDLRIDAATDAWAVGAAGERAVAAVLERCPGVAVLHDRARSGSRANLDHVLVARSGAYVIDTKAYRATVELYRYGCWPLWRTGLLVAGRERGDMLATVRAQACAVELALSAPAGPLRGVPVLPVLCFVGSDWRLPVLSACVEGVALTCPEGLPWLLRRRGRLDAPDIAEVARSLDRAFPRR